MITQCTEDSMSTTTRDSTDTPPPPPGPDSTGPWVIDRLKRAREEAREANETAREALTIAKEIKDAFGVSTNEALGIVGKGLLGAFERLASKVDDLSTKMDSLMEAIEKRQAAFVWAVKVVVSALLVSATGASLAWLTSLHH